MIKTTAGGGRDIWLVQDDKDLDGCSSSSVRLKSRLGIWARSKGQTSAMWVSG